jgi:hypothetical protein
MAASEGDAEQWGIDQRDCKTFEDIEKYGAAIFAQSVAAGVQGETA